MCSIVVAMAAPAQSHPLNSAAQVATILNDVPTFIVGRAFLQLHRPLAYDAGQQIDQGAFVVIQIMSALFVGGLQENPLRPLQLSEGFVRAKFPRSLRS
jgi:hypothetical protein